tara:strand:+ start:1200 stop:1376 length:177 start_codon:yes stop_codon:yes gene_type:complete
MGERLLRISQVEAIVGRKRATIYRKIKEQKFPPPIKDGFASYWTESEIDAYVNNIINA